MAWYDLFKAITAKIENVGQIYINKHLDYTILVKYCLMAISRTSNRFLIGIEKSLSQKGIIKVYENILIQPSQVHEVLFNIHSERNKIDAN